MEKLEIKAEKIGEEVLHEPCEALAYCHKYSHIISNEVRWDNCHTTNHLSCDYRGLLRKLGAV